MKEKLKGHLDELFKDAPKIPSANELKEELLTNSIERYDDLVAGGMPPDEAYANVVDNIGDINDLLASIKVVHTEAELSAWRKKSALITSISVGIYILAGILFLAWGILWAYPEIGFLVAIAICIPPTCLLVYNAKMYPAYKKSENTVVESIIASHSDTKRAKAVRSSISTILWILTVIIYFLVSFTTGAWYITWITFLVAICVEAIISLIFNIKGMK